MKRNETKKRTVLRKTADVLLWAFLAFSVLMTALALTAQADKNRMPVVGGRGLLYVLSDSMTGENGFNKGDLLIVEAVRDDEERKNSLTVGEVVTFVTQIGGKPALNTHRIVGVTYSAGGSAVYTTKGDHNPAEDEKKVVASEIVAVWHGRRVPAAGAVLGFLQSPAGFLSCTVLPLFAFFIYKLALMIRALLVLRTDGVPGGRVISAGEEERIRKEAVEEYLARQKESGGKGE